MRIWYQHMAPFKETWRTYDDILKSHTAKMFSDMVVDHYWVEKGHSGMEYKLLNAYNVVDGFKKVLEAQEKGYDGAVIGCSMDVGVREIRQVVNIPVAGLAESGMLCGCLLGQRFASITTNKMMKSRIEELVRIYGLEDRALSVKSIGMSLEELGKALDEPEKLKKLFVREAKNAVEEGADVILCGCGLLDALCIQEGINRIRDTPVVDSVVASISLVKVLITLRKAGISIGRAGIYASPSVETIEEAKRLYEYKRSV